jgi:hypothetical protein
MIETRTAKYLIFNLPPKFIFGRHRAQDGQVVVIVEGVGDEKSPWRGGRIVPFLKSYTNNSSAHFRNQTEKGQS